MRCSGLHKINFGEDEELTACAVPNKPQSESNATLCKPETRDSCLTLSHQLFRRRTERIPLRRQRAFGRSVRSHPIKVDADAIKVSVEIMTFSDFSDVICPFCGRRSRP